MRKVIFLHGIESSPKGTKATYLGEQFGAVSPALRHLRLNEQVGATRQLLGEDTAVIVGSSLGGLTALGLAITCPENISHLILLAPAVGTFSQASFAEEEKIRPGLYREVCEFATFTIPKEVPCTMIQGLEDSVVDPAAVIGLCTRSKSSHLILVHDDHPLSRSQQLITAVVGRAANNRSIGSP
ncbi:MAG: alpha/beta fold hydrolase [Proteobacteria bacterium]|nr:alpha/beta fold hydrolase [Pseudomonadota bacterium]